MAGLIKNQILKHLSKYDLFYTSLSWYMLVDVQPPAALKYCWIAFNLISYLLRGQGKMRGARCEEGKVRGRVRGGTRLVGYK